jgi:hypothetical protein
LAGFFAFFRDLSLAQAAPPCKVSQVSPSSLAINSKLQNLCREGVGRTLRLDFLLLLISITLPINARSPAWALRISSRSVDTVAFPLLAFVLSSSQGHLSGIAKLHSSVLPLSHGLQSPLKQRNRRDRATQPAHPDASLILLV